MVVTFAQTSFVRTDVTEKRSLKNYPVPSKRRKRYTSFTIETSLLRFNNFAAYSLK